MHRFTAFLLACASLPCAADPGYFQDTRPLPELPDPGAIVATVPIDADGDGDEDLFLAYGAVIAADGATIALADRLLLAGPGGWTLSSQTFDAAAPTIAADAIALDIDRDGDRDLLVAGGTTYSGGNSGGTIGPSRSQLYRNLGGGQFAAPVDPWSPNRLTGIAAIDLDGDSDPDVVTTDAGGNASVFRNDTAGPGASPLFTARGAFRVTPSGVSAAAVRPVFGDFQPGGGPDLAVLYAGDSGSPPGVAFLAASTAQPPLTLLNRVALPVGAQVQDLAAGELDPAAGDELLVAAMPGIAQNPNPSALLRRAGAGYEVAPLRFGESGARRVRIADLDGDGLDDAVLALARLPDRCGVAPRRAAGASLLVLLQSGGGLGGNGQCLGAHVEGPRTLALARPAAGALPAIAATGPDATCPALEQDELAIFTNNAASTSTRCCIAEASAAGPNNGSGPAAPARGGLLPPGDGFRANVFLRARDELLTRAASGPRLTARYYEHSPEIVLRMLVDPALRAQVGSVLDRWSGLLEAWFAGNPPLVDAASIDAVDALLVSLSTGASPALAVAITEERAALPPFDQLADLPFETFLDRVLPEDVVLRDGFEEAAP